MPCVRLFLPKKVWSVIFFSRKRSLLEGLKVIFKNVQLSLEAFPLGLFFLHDFFGRPIDKILVGKVNKYFSQICFLEQGFVKEEKQSIKDLIAEKSKAIDDTIQVKRYIRFQLGGE